jgi:hypothetical protein
LCLRRIPAHRPRQDAQHVDRAQEVDLDDLREVVKRRRPVTAHELAGRGEPGADHHHTQASRGLRGGIDGRLNGGRIGDVRVHGAPAHLCRQRLGAIAREIGHDDVGALPGQAAHRGLTEAGRAVEDDGSRSFDLHPRATS